jgi:DmsE family decaheme c-type cytochrome
VNNAKRLCAATLVCLFTAAAATRWVDAQQAAQSQPTSPPAQAALPAGYAGTDACVLCHEEQGKDIEHSKHWLKANPRAPAATLGCESCHGPGQAHIDDEAKGHIKKFGALKPSEISDTCLTCHNRGDHAAWDGSVHDPVATDRQLVKATETALCATCHRTQVIKTERAVAHMPVREGKMSCSSCHNPHGSIANVKALRVGSSVSESCMSCHAEMRGPMLWEHVPVRENCTTCHDPHGSSNDRMLVVRQPMLCQRCHVATRHPSSIYDNNAILNRSNRMFGRSCVNCHSNIHGSNHPSGQFFMR